MLIENIDHRDRDANDVGITVDVDHWISFRLDVVMVMVLMRRESQNKIFDQLLSYDFLPSQEPINEFDWAPSACDFLFVVARYEVFLTRRSK